MKTPKKRKATRLFEDDPNKEALLPVRKTTELVDQHLWQYNAGQKNRMKNPPPEFGNRDNGKEEFDALLNAMSTPEKKED